MKGFSYVVPRDYGFAPNPFGEYCTLATCKPLIRRCANVGDLILGITPKGKGNKLIYAMIVDEKLTFNEYWTDERFQYKKPVLNGSIVEMMGDNIYFYNEHKKKWIQADSHHSLDKGKINKDNVLNDTQSDSVLVSTHFIYFGKDSVSLPPSFKEEIIVGRSHRCINDEDSKAIWLWLKKSYPPGIHADPTNFRKFTKY
jgi:hypothetical protein